MASFAITSFSSTPQTLASFETGFVGPDGVLYTANSTAITGNGSVQVLALGWVASLGSNTVVINSAVGMDFQIGPEGGVTSGSATALVATGSNLLGVTNSGTIEGGTTGLILAHTDGAVGIDVANTGEILGRAAAAAILNAGTGSVRMTSSGTIVTTNATVAVEIDASFVQFANFGTVSSSSLALDIDLANGGSAFVRNTGTIDGNIDVSGPGSLLLRNRGLIDGTVTGTQNDDTFDLRGGRVTGFVIGGNGGDTYIVDSGDVGIVDSGGSDSIVTSVGFTLRNGLENLELTGMRNLVGRGNDLDN
jgi:hypothetical protein